MMKRLSTIITTTKIPAVSSATTTRKAAEVHGGFCRRRLHNFPILHNHRKWFSAAAAGSGSGSPAPSLRIPENDDDDRQQQQHLKKKTRRSPVIPYPQSPRRSVPDHIIKPPYATSLLVAPPAPNQILLHNESSAHLQRQAAQIAAQTLQMACELAATACTCSSDGMTTDAIDQAVHEELISRGAYPSPLGYAGFPKSVCTSVNEIICHGIPDLRPLERGDLISLDVSCYYGGVHGDNCASVIVGEGDEDDEDEEDARRLLETTRESLYAAIDTIVPGKSCLSDIGAAIQQLADEQGYHSIHKYRGHGIGSDFHCPPFVKHYQNEERLTLQPGMIFTIEPMLCQYQPKNGVLDECFEWDDHWTVSTTDLGLAAQFEHTVYLREDGEVEILTELPEDYNNNYSEFPIVNRRRQQQRKER